MNKEQWEAFYNFRKAFKDKCTEWNNKYKDILFPLQKAACKKDTPEYSLETAVVYNTAFDAINENDEIKLIVIGDNPGKDEQLAKNNKYLVGQSGKIAEGFFKRNPELNIDFRKNAIILNKTPIHTAKTNHLKKLSKEGGKEIAALILESQIWLAKETAKLHQALYSPELWLVGYAELKNRGIFTAYRDELKKGYENKNYSWKKVFVYQHFSMNRFLVDLSAYRAINQASSLKESLEILGTKHKNEIFLDCK
ncbi:MAG: hypothetical protein K6F69_07995 [Treponema sp.]|nr:hypothetical protein [Treponema sp.]